MGKHNRSESEVMADESTVAEPTIPADAPARERAPRGSLPPKTYTKASAAGAIAKILSGLNPEDRAAVLAFVS